MVNVVMPITRLGDSDQLAGAIDLVSVGSVTTDIVVTAVRDGSGNLKLIQWSMA
jgi:hypothetical protein